MSECGLLEISVSKDSDTYICDYTAYSARPQSALTLSWKPKIFLWDNLLCTHCTWYNLKAMKKQNLFPLNYWSFPPSQHLPLQNCVHNLVWVCQCQRMQTRWYSFCQHLSASDSWGSFHSCQGSWGNEYYPLGRWIVLHTLWYKKQTMSTRCYSLTDNVKKLMYSFLVLIWYMKKNVYIVNHNTKGFHLNQIRHWKSLTKENTL